MRRKEERKRIEKKLFSRASQAATALHSWAVEISHKADASYQVLALLATFPIADSQLWFARRQGCMFVNVLYFFSMPVWVWMFVALERCPRQREMSLRRLRSGYYLCSASVTESEEGASIMWGSVSPGSIRDSPGDRSAFQFLMLMSES